MSKPLAVKRLEIVENPAFRYSLHSIPRHLASSSHQSPYTYENIMAPLSGSAKKKKQKEKERELQRLKVIEERQAGSDTSPEEDIPASQPYGPWDEPKEKWDARLEAQPPAEKYSAFEERAKARKGQPIEYQPAAIPDEQTLHVDASTKFDSTAKPVQKLVFASGINVDEYVGLLSEIVITSADNLQHTR
jgi:hypothetical protein